MTPYGVILLILLFWAQMSKFDNTISENLIEFDTFVDSMISSSSSIIISSLNSTLNSSTAETFSSNEQKLRFKRHYYYPTYMNNFIEQRVHGNRIPQCPCVINPGSNRCIAYDSRYQAASVEEAIVSFPDFSDDHSYLDGPIDERIFLCKTLECQACSKLLIERLKTIGFLDWNARLMLNIPYNVDTRYCRRLRFAKPRRTYPPPKNISPAMREIIREGKRRISFLEHQKLQSRKEDLSHMAVATGPYYVGSRPYVERPAQWIAMQPTAELVQPMETVSVPVQFVQTVQSPTYVQSPHITPPSSSYPSGPVTYQQPTRSGNAEYVRRFQRSKRQSVGERIIGNRFVISCVDRGEPESEDSDMLTLCGTCWTWRQLPEDYFPRLVNELVCKRGLDGYCLSGWGQCEQKFRNLDVLRKVNGEWRPTTISTASCCNCRVKAGTEIHALVVGEA